MHVCLLTTVLDAYKGGNHLPLLGALRDVRFTVVTNGVKPESPALPPNVSVVTLHERLGSYYYGFADARFARAVLKRYPIRSDFWKQFDLIHLNQTLHSSLLRLQETGKPVLYFVHHPVSADLAIAVEESAFASGCVWRMKYLMPGKWQRDVCRGAQHVATVSDTVKARLQEDYGCDGGKISVVRNGVDGSLFTLMDEAEYDICAVGSFLHPRKGFRYLLETYKRISGFGFQIADVGRRSGEQQRALATIPNVKVHGMVGHDELVRVIQRSKVLISVSLYEGFGLSLIEALACGRPVVAFDGGAVREVLGPIDGRMVVPARDTGALVDRVRAFTGISVKERSAFREKVLERYSLEKSAQALGGLYRGLKSGESG